MPCRTLPAAWHRRSTRATSSARCHASKDPSDGEGEEDEEGAAPQALQEAEEEGDDPEVAQWRLVMPLIQLIVILIVIGLVLYLVESLLTIDPQIKQIIRVVLVIAVILWLLSLVGLLPTRITHALEPWRMLA